MSDRARSQSLVALAERNSAFAPDMRFGMRVDPASHRSDPVAEMPLDPIADAFARGYAQGAEAGALAERAHAAAQDAARHRIESALAQMDQAETAAFTQRLSDTVLALCAAMLGDAAIAPDILARRAATAAAMFNRAGDERVIRLHPEDLALVHDRLPDAWHCEPDPQLERGAIRIECSTGGVEDGPAQWRTALTQALQLC